jgi:uncharacterized protein YfiM (DUF2279 family)
MGREPDDQAVERLLGERGQHLMRAAVALTGGRAPAADKETVNRRSPWFGAGTTVKLGERCRLGGGADARRA